MDQTSNGGFKKNESALQAFYHSCLGKIAILIGILIVLFIVALMTKPTQDEMEMEMVDNILQCIEANDSIQGDEIDDQVNNLNSMFSRADTAKINKELLTSLKKNNRLETVVEVPELVCHVEVALGVCDDGFDSRHIEFEDDVLEVAAAVHVRHLDEDRAVGIGKEFVEVVGDATLEVLDDHVFGGQGRRKLTIDNGHVNGSLGCNLMALMSISFLAN